MREHNKKHIERNKCASDNVERFLKAGGKIKVIERQKLLDKNTDVNKTKRKKADLKMVKQVVGMVKKGDFR